MLFKHLQKLGSLSKNGQTANQHASNQLANNPKNTCIPLAIRFSFPSQDHPRSVLHGEPRTKLTERSFSAIGDEIVDDLGPNIAHTKRIVEICGQCGTISHAGCLESRGLLLFAS